MKKLLLSLMALVCGLVSMNATTVDFTSQTITANDDGFTIEVSPYTFTALKNDGSTAPTQNGTYKDLRLYAKSTLEVTSTTTMTQMVFTISTQGKKRLTEITASTGEVAVDATNWTVTWTGSAGDVTFTVGDKATYGTDGSTKAGQFDIDAVEITEAGGTVTTKKAAGLKWTPSSITYYQGNTFTAPVFTKATTAEVTFTTDDDEVATVDANGVITLAGSLGPVNITATTAGNEEYEAGTATCTITVNAQLDTISVTCAEAAQIAQAMESNNTPSAAVYRLTGYVTSTNGTVSNGQQVFYMADEKDGGNVFEGYWANIPDANDPLTVGSKIEMTGYIMKYNTTSEMKNGNVKVLEKVVVKVDTIACNAAEAYAACQALASGAYSSDYYKITAYVDSVTYAYSNGTESFTLTDTKGVHGDSLVVYKASIAEAVEAGTKVCIVGKLQNYKGTVMEVTSGKATIIKEEDEPAVDIKARADVNGDGVVNIADVNAVISVMCGAIQ